jgi:two-component system KDP operon response regulator KdpE
MKGSGETILVVDDEPQIHRFLTPALAAAGYNSIRANRGDEALYLAATKAPEAILLDLGLPDMNGQTVLQELRKFTDVPIIIISARSCESEKVAALDAGADDFIGKPFGNGELFARLRSALRSRLREKVVDENIRFGPLSIDTVTRRISIGNAVVSLSKHEHDLILLLVRNVGCLLPHSEILTAIWGPAHADDVTYLRVYVGRLRQKLGPEFASLIITEAGVGYRLRSPGDAATES